MLANVTTKILGIYWRCSIFVFTYFRYRNIENKVICELKVLPVNLFEPLIEMPLPNFSDG